MNSEYWILCIDIARDAIQHQQGNQNLDCIYYCIMIKGKSWNQCGELIHASSTGLKPFYLTIREDPFPFLYVHFTESFWDTARIGFAFSAFALCFFNSTCLLLCWRLALIELQPQSPPGRVQILFQTASVALEMPDQYAEVLDCRQCPYGHQNCLCNVDVMG